MGSWESFSKLGYWGKLALGHLQLAAATIYGNRQVENTWYVPKYALDC